MNIGLRQMGIRYKKMEEDLASNYMCKVRKRGLSLILLHIDPYFSLNNFTYF